MVLQNLIFSRIGIIMQNVFIYLFIYFFHNAVWAYRTKNIAHWLVSLLPVLWAGDLNQKKHLYLHLYYFYGNSSTDKYRQFFFTGSQLTDKDNWRPDKSPTKKKQKKKKKNLSTLFLSFFLSCSYLNKRGE